MGKEGSCDYCFGCVYFVSFVVSFEASFLSRFVLVFFIIIVVGILFIYFLSFSPKATLLGTNTVTFIPGG